jgi:membrane-bound serine protease (ClpP class)
MNRPSPARILLGMLILALSCLSAFAGEDDEAQGEENLSPGVIHLRIEGPLDVGTLGLLQRGIRTAQEEGSEVLLIEIDTPGGAIDLMIQFARQIEEAGAHGILTAAWVRGEATSAGVLVSLACDRIFMGPTSTMGSSTPVMPGPAGMQALPEEGGIREKVNSLVRSEFRAIAVNNGRSPQIAEAMVDASIEVREVELRGETRLMTATEWRDARVRGEDPQHVRTISEEGRLVNLTAHEAVELGMADGVARSIDEVLLRLGRSEQRIVTLERTRSEDLLAFLSMISPILMTIGLLLGYTELKTQGFGLAGILSLCCFLIVFTGKYMVGLADVPHIVLLFLGFGLIATEIFVLPGQLWPGILGGLLLFGSLIAMEMGTDFDFSSAYVRGQAFDASFRLSLVAVASVVGALVLSHYLPDTPILKRLVQMPAVATSALGEGSPEASGEHAEKAHVGAYGSAITDLRPVGKVVLDTDEGLDYEARAVGDAIDSGLRVRVVRIQGGRLVVEDAREGIE